MYSIRIQQISTEIMMDSIIIRFKALSLREMVQVTFILCKTVKMQLYSTPTSLARLLQLFSETYLTPVQNLLFYVHIQSYWIQPVSLLVHESKFYQMPLQPRNTFIGQRTVHSLFWPALAFPLQKPYSKYIFAYSLFENSIFRSLPISQWLKSIKYLLKTNHNIGIYP